MQFVFNDGSGVKVVRLPRWAMYLAFAGVIVVGALLLMLAAGFALVILPVALVVGGIASWYARKRGRVVYEEWGRAEGRAEGASTVIEGEYRVIDRTRSE